MKPPPFNLQAVRALLLKSAQKMGEDKIPRMAAAFSFYTVLALAPLLVLVVVAGSYVIGATTAETTIMTAAKEHLGEQSQPLVKDLLKGVANPNISTFAGILSILVTLLGASGIFVQLEDSVNTIWGTQPKGSFFRNLIVGRLVALVMVLIFGLIAVSWLILDSWLGWLGRETGEGAAWRGISFIASVAFLIGVFAVAYRSIPKGTVAWRDVWLGATIAGIGVAIGKYLLGFYFAHAGVAAAYGASGALVVVLLWIYYTSQIFFFGFEVTHVFARERGSHINRSAEGSS